jgi:hypothetical protein
VLITTTTTENDTSITPIHETVQHPNDILIRFIERDAGIPSSPVLRLAGYPVTAVIHITDGPVQIKNDYLAHEHTPYPLLFLRI